MSLLYDTNIVVYLVRNLNRQKLISIINPDNKKIFMSVVAVGELRSIALQNNWGPARFQVLSEIMSGITVVEITENFSNTYAQIDAFSQRRNPAYSNYPFKTPRNMGKNDLWIAATAALLGFKLVTTDADFMHLNDVFLEVKYVKTELLK